jgi:predicted amidophosphoribosyltransferase
MSLGDPEVVYLKLAKGAFESGNYQRCLEFARKFGSSPPSDLRLPVCISAYKVGVDLAAANKFRDAREMFSLAGTLAEGGPLRRLCQDRLRLVQDPLKQPPLSPEHCPVCRNDPVVREACKVARDMLAPEINEVYCIGAYRSGWDQESSNRFSQAIRSMKSANGKPVAEGLAVLLAHFFVVHLGADIRRRVDLIAPVPTTASRYAKRGFCIPETLAQKVSRTTTIPSYPGLIKLTRETPDLRLLNRSQRQDALEGAFSVSLPEMVQGLTILVVDDVMTYGTTLRQMGHVLRQSGASQVIALVLAHTESSR